MNPMMPLLLVYNAGFSVTSPVNTCRKNFNASSANSTIFACRSDVPVRTSLLTTPSGVATAKATYPLADGERRKLFGWRGDGTAATYGVCVGVATPGPAEPDSLIAYAALSFF